MAPRSRSASMSTTPTGRFPDFVSAGRAGFPARRLPVLEGPPTVRQVGRDFGSQLQRKTFLTTGSQNTVYPSKMPKFEADSLTSRAD